jgi:hypothetical protein
MRVLLCFPGNAKPSAAAWQCAKTRAAGIARNLARRGSIPLDWVSQNGAQSCAGCFHAVSFARSGFGHKAEQFSHEQIWQKPERSLGKRRGMMAA